MLFDTRIIQYSKFYIHALNALLLVQAVLFICFGATYTSYFGLQFFKDAVFFSNLDAILICGGLLFMVTAVLGSLGTMKEHHTLIKTYASLILAICLLQPITAYMLLILDPSTSLKSNMGLTMYKYNTDNKVQEAWDSLQQTHYCCGVIEPYDWNHLDVDGPIIPYLYTSYKVPPSCCSQIENCNAEHGGPIHTDGCWDVFKETFYYITLVPGCIAIFMCVFEIVGLVLAFKLADYLKRKRFMERQRQMASLYSNSNFIYTVPQIKKI